MRGMKVPTATRAALRKVPNKADFCARHNVPLRTFYNLLDRNHSATRTTLLVVKMALQAEKLLPADEPAKAAQAAA